LVGGELCHSVTACRNSCATGGMPPSDQAAGGVDGQGPRPGSVAFENLIGSLAFLCQTDCFGGQQPGDGEAVVAFYGADLVKRYPGGFERLFHGPGSGFEPCEIRGRDGQVFLRLPLQNSTRKKVGRGRTDGTCCRRGRWLPRTSGRPRLDWHRRCGRIADLRIEKWRIDVY